MSREEILLYFKDINQAYNNASMYDSLSKLLDEYAEEVRTDAIDESCENSIKWLENHDAKVREEAIDKLLHEIYEYDIYFENDEMESLFYEKAEQIKEQKNE